MRFDEFAGSQGRAEDDQPVLIRQPVRAPDVWPKTRQASRRRPRSGAPGFGFAQVSSDACVRFDCGSDFVGGSAGAPPGGDEIDVVEVGEEVMPGTSFFELNVLSSHEDKIPTSFRPDAFGVPCSFRFLILECVFD